MKHFLTTVLLMLCAMAQAQFSSAPAFPGAEGYGRYVTGGRGGTVYHVTSLEDYCDNKDYSSTYTTETAIPGTLRYAVRQSGARIIVFDVAGTIVLKSPLKIANDDITILGQTAPGDGITLRDQNVNIQANNVIIRYLRFRMGDKGKRYYKNGTLQENPYVEDDALNAYQKSGSEKTGIIIDHCSMSWCTDECGTFYGNRNFTLQWCILSESLRNSVHEKGAHGYGGIWGGEKASFHHNLLANHDSRNPRFDHDYVSTLKGPVDYTNNVVYNWGSYSTYGGESGNGTAKKFNMINNYYKPGPYTNHLGYNTNRLLNPTTTCSNCTDSEKFPGTTGSITPGKFYISGNKVNGSNATISTTNIAFDSGYDLAQFQANCVLTSMAKSDESQFNYNHISLHNADDAYTAVTNYAGASLKRDAVDTRILSDMNTGNYTPGSNDSSYGLIDSQSDVGGWPTLTGTAPADTDGDGIPDNWEDCYGLDKNDASDAVTYSLDPNGYYMNIEVYANSLVEATVKAQRADATETFTEYYPELADATACDITACTIAGEDATIDGTTITAEVAYEYSTTVPVTLTLSSGASADSGTSFNMTLAATSGATTDKTIIVTAPNGINTQTYTLTLTRALAPPSTWGLTQGNLTTSTGISTTTTYSGELISSFTNTSAAMGASSSTRSLTNGTTSISSVNGAACQRNNLCPAATDFVENCYYAFTLNVATGYKLNISQIFGDLYYDNSRAGKYKFAVYQGTTKVWEAGSSDYVTTGSSSDSHKTLSTSSVEALQGLTGAVQVRMVWYQGGSSSYVALKDFNITAQLEEDSRTLYDLNTTASPTEGGIITLNPTGGAYEEGTEVTMTATANDGYYFVNWTDANDQQVATTSDYVYEMGTEAASFTANFGKYPVVSFSKGDTGAEGTVPADMYTTTGTIVVPANNSLYIAGKTLTAWKLGETEYEIGDLINGITSDVTLTPVFTINAFALSEMPKTTVSIPFTQNGGAPIMVAQGSGNPSTMCVAQATVGNKFIDVLLSVDATNGKFNNNQGNPDNCQVNATTTLTLPAVNGMKITLNKAFSTSYIGTNTTGTTSDGSTTWTYNGSGETVTLTINESDKYPTLMTLTYPNGTKTITLGQNGYSTFAGEHNYTVSGEGQACTGDYNSTSKKVALTACDAGAIIEKGAGIVLRGAQEGDEVTITYTDDDATVASGATGFVGVISTTTGINDNPYVLSSNGTKTAFVKAGAYGTVEALMNMAYLDGSANSINSFLVDFDDKATGVEAIYSQQTATHAYYTIDGRRLSARPTAKGVYIIGNKITVIE